MRLFASATRNFVFCLCLLSASLAGAGDEKFGEEVAAQQEMQNLETAITALYLDTGYYLSLESLNDLAFDTQPPYDYINSGSGAHVMRPEVGRFEGTPRFFTTTSNPMWNGPYATYQQGTTQIGPLPYDEGSPLDPWGSPYYFFSPLGLIRGDSGAVTIDLYGDFFDRYAIVTLGPDGIVSTDDIIRRFGSGVTAFAISSLSGPKTYKQTRLDVPKPETEFFTEAGSAITLKGRVLGPAQNGSKLFFNEIELTQISGWSDQLINFTLPPMLEGTGLITVRQGAAQSNGLRLTIFPNSVDEWADYE